MGAIAKAQMSLGTIISATIETVRINARPVLFFVALFTIVGTLVDYAEMSGTMADEIIVGLWQLSLGIAAIIATYFLLETMLRQAGLMDSFGVRRILPYVGQAIVMTVGIVFGIIMLIVPGLILLARWALAPALLIGQGMGVFDAMKRSWDLTRGHTVTIIIAAIVLFAIAGLAGVLIYLFFGEESLVALLVAQVLQNGVSALSAAFGVALLGMLEDGARELDEVFA
jgi:membrane-anchored glycerophosphoryl diester phosphodiesterase (GDPDase)